MIFKRFEEGFKDRGHSDLFKIEKDLNFLVRKGIQIRKDFPQISRVVLIARMLNGERENMPVVTRLRNYIWSRKPVMQFLRHLDTT